MVSFSVVTALAVNYLLERYVPVMQSIDKQGSALFWIRSIILVGLVYFGYQTVISVQRLAAKAGRERLADSLFGAVMGGFNGYLIAGTLLFYLISANYTALPNIITPPTDPNVAAAITTMMNYMPPRWLGEPTIYFAVIIILIFIIVVYI